MNKRIITTVLAVSMVLPMVVPTFAITEKDKFIKSFEVTNKVLQYEQKLINNRDLSSIVLKNLLGNTYQNKISIGVNDLYLGEDLTAEQTEALKQAKLVNTQKVNPIDNSLVQETNIILPTKLLVGNNKDVNLDINMFLSKDKVTLSIPQLFPKTYSINPNDIASKWNTSPIGTLMPLTPEQLTAVSQVQKSLNTKGLDYDKIEKDAKAISTKYTDFFKKYLDKGTFTQTQSKMIESKRGKLLVDKNTFRLNSVNSNIMVSELSEFMKNDKDLYNLYASIYGSMNNVLGMDIAKTAIDMYADAISQIEFKDELLFSIYTNKANQILRYELDFNIFDSTFDETNKINAVLDTKGNNYLLNEIEMSATITDENEATDKIQLYSVGNYVPKDGVFDSNIKVTNTYTDSESTENTEILNMDYKWDTNKKEDNIMMNMILKDSFGDNYDASITGNMITDNKNKILDVNLKKILFSFDDNFIDLNFRATYNKIQPQDIKEPKDVVDILKMTEEELNKDFTDISTKLEEYN